MHPAIAIDGPAASGKSTVAKLIADRLGYTFINTGAMYRAITWYMLEQGINPADTAAVLESLPSVPLSFGKDGSRSVVLCGQHVLAKNSRAGRSTTTFPPLRPSRKYAPCWWNGSGNITAGNPS